MRLFFLGFLGSVLLCSSPWEYRSSSSLELVWSFGRSGSISRGTPNLRCRIQFVLMDPSAHRFAASSFALSTIRYRHRLLNKIHIVRSFCWINCYPIISDYLFISSLIEFSKESVNPSIEFSAIMFVIWPII